LNAFEIFPRHIQPVLKPQVYITNVKQVLYKTTTVADHQYRIYANPSMPYDKITLNQNMVITIKEVTGIRY